jgi:hypothetical protein
MCETERIIQSLVRHPHRLCSDAHNVLAPVRTRPGHLVWRRRGDQIHIISIPPRDSTIHSASPKNRCVYVCVSPASTQCTHTHMCDT